LYEEYLKVKNSIDFIMEGNQWRIVLKNI
jgi:hypothetical protein